MKQNFPSIEISSRDLLSIVVGAQNFKRLMRKEPVVIWKYNKELVSRLLDELCYWYIIHDDPHTPHMVIVQIIK